MVWRTTYSSSRTVPDHEGRGGGRPGSLGKRSTALKGVCLPGWEESEDGLGKDIEEVPWLMLGVLRPTSTWSRPGLSNSDTSWAPGGARTSRPTSKTPADVNPPTPQERSSEPLRQCRHPGRSAHVRFQDQWCLEH